MASGCALAANAGTPTRLPNRQLSCDLGHATNVDFTKEQKTSDMVFDTHHALSLFLPGIPVRTTEPPDATAPAEPVDKRTRITSDPSGLMHGVAPGFVRVIDLWPERVEMTRKVNEAISKLIILSNVDASDKTADIFITDAQDLATFDPEKIYIGTCHYQIVGR